jgi:hypothetical protein
MEVMLEEYNSRTTEQRMTMDQFKISMLEAFDKQILNKLSRGGNPSMFDKI